MTPQEYERVREVFLAARELESDDQAAYVRRACEGDESLRVEVESLLANHDDQDAFLDSPALGTAFPLDFAPSAEALQNAGVSGSQLPPGTVPTPPSDHPEQIGPYRITRTLGWGGMGVVYLAQQENPRRQVALKVVHSGVGSRAILRRFEQEAHLLGRLQHPGIAQVYDAGTADAGHGKVPYFAMEYIDGTPLTDHADTNRMGARSRLELFRRVCDAVQHAHQKGVIHRDLKPANILVDTTGQPRVLDFGVARATDADLEATTLRTDVGQLIGTIPYMSPEQVAGDPDKLDTRSDVYALGVVLYELLAGRLPYDLRNKTIPEAVRVIREDDPVPLSSIAKSFRGDLETIIAKALEKDVERRYSSASDLAADLRHYLEDEPITARPASTIYQLRKFARRNRALVVGVAAAFLLLVAGVIGTSIGLARAWRAEELARHRLTDAQQARLSAEEAQSHAEQEAEKLKATRNFFSKQVIEAAFPGRIGPEVTVIEAVDRAVPRIGEAFEGYPETEASVRHYIGNIYQELARYEDAEVQLVGALDNWRASVGREHKQTSSTEAWMAKLYQRQGRFEEAERLMREVLEIRRRMFDERDPWIYDAVRRLASVLHDRGKHEEAVTLLNDAYRDVLRLGSVDALAERTLLNTLTGALRVVGRADDGWTLHGSNVERLRGMHGETHPTTFYAAGAKARFAQACGRFEEGEAIVRAMIEVSAELWGRKDYRTLNTEQYLCHSLRGQEKLDEAAALLARVVADREAAQGKAHTATLHARVDLAATLHAAGELEEAETVARETLARRRASRGEGHPDTPEGMVLLATILRDRKQTSEAEALLRESLEVRGRVWGPVHRRTLDSVEALADLLVESGRKTEAVTVYREALDAQRLLDRGDYPETARALESYAELLERVGGDSEALSTWREVLAIHRRVRGEEHSYTKRALDHVGSPVSH